MADIKFEVLEELGYNNVVTLKVIENNELLNTIFVDEIKIPYKELYRLISSNELDDITEEYIRYVFDSGITTDNKLIQKYKLICDELNISIEKPIAEEIAEVVLDSEEETEEVKPTKVVKYPRRFGKEKVNAQIADQGGEVTLAQTAMLRSNDLKNLYVRMDKLLIKALHSEEHALTNTEYLAIISTVNIVENKFKAIFKKHKNDPK